MQLSCLRKPPQVPKHILSSLFILIMLVFPLTVMSQELVSTEFAKGYVKDGSKYSVWEYYNSNKELELKINHTTGKVYFLKEDTSQYVIEKNGEWIEQKLRIYPIPTDGYHNFHQKIKNNIRYPVEARRMGIDGVVTATFEVDSTGVPGNYRILRGISGACDNEVLRVLKQTETLWIPAQINGRTYRSKFIVPITFSLGSNPFSVPNLILPQGKVLRQNALAAVGIGRESVSLGYHAPRNEFLVRTYASPRYSSLKEALAARRKVQYISLAGQNLKRFPAEMVKLDDLIYLDLENNNLTELPGHISILKKLEELYFPFNRLKSLPRQFTALKKLNTLSLGSNQFSKFPRQICSCRKLEVLDLGENKISEIPPCIADLKKLKIIALNSNQIRSLPEGFYNLKRLEAIYLKDNPLQEETVKRIHANFRKAKIVLE